MNEVIARTLHEYFEKYDMRTVCNMFPEFSEMKIKRAISDHIDRTIENHRKAKLSTPH